MKKCLKVLKLDPLISITLNLALKIVILKTMSIRVITQVQRSGILQEAYFQVISMLLLRDGF